MKIQIDGVNTQNKGAELMLVAILEEIERRVPNAEVWINPNGRFDKSLLPKTNLQVKQRFFLKSGKNIRKLLSKLRLPHNYFTHFYAKKGVDLMLDASGFQYSDQWNHSSKSLDIRENYYANLKSNGTKIVFLPQALGPFETKNGLRSAAIIKEYCDILFAREEQSFEYITKATGDNSNVNKSCDFTFKVKGEISADSANLNRSICIIPNKKMVTHTDGNKQSYVKLLENLIQYSKDKSLDVILLNHEGVGDETLCHELNALFNNSIKVYTGLSAKEVKGVIGQSYVVVSSRFHGVASALSQGVPCLATSWNHKYEMLFKDFGQQDRILKSSDEFSDSLLRLEDVLQNHSSIKETINKNKESKLVEINGMWEKIFSQKF